MRTIIIAVMLLVSATINAQVMRNGNTFSVKSNTEKVDSITKYTWEDKSGVAYKVYKSSRSFYIWRKSKKTGKMYKQYLPKDVQAIMKKEYGIASK